MSSSPASLPLGRGAMPRHADYSHTLGCSSFEIANPRLSPADNVRASASRLSQSHLLRRGPLSEWTQLASLCLFVGNCAAFSRAPDHKSVEGFNVPIGAR